MPETLYEFRVWAEGSLTDTDGNPLDTDGQPIPHDEPSEGDQPEGDPS